MRDIVLWDDYTAKIEAIASVNIRAQVGGYLKSINFKEGENVKKGDLLFVIDPRPYEAALASAEAELAEAKARVELAKTNLERAKELYAADVVAKELLDTRNYEMLSSNAVLASAEAKVRNAKLNLEYTSIRAPMSGKISEALVSHTAYGNTGVAYRNVRIYGFVRILHKQYIAFGHSACNRYRGRQRDSYCGKRRAQYEARHGREKGDERHYGPRPKRPNRNNARVERVSSPRRLSRASVGNFISNLRLR